MIRLFAALLTGFFLLGCDESTNIPRSQEQTLVDSGNFGAALQSYRSQLAQNPDDPELLQAYYAAYEDAEMYYFDRARSLARNGNIPSAEGEIGRGLLLVPDSSILRDEMERLKDLKHARKLYRDATVSARLGRRDKAISLVEDALSRDPEYQAAISLLQTLYATQSAADQIKPIRLQTGAPVSINFQNAAFKEASLALGRAYGVNMIFDADLQDRAISVYADQVKFTQALELLLKSNRAFYRRLGANSIVIASDTPGKRAEYEDYMVRTFFIKSSEAQAVADRLALTLGLQTISVDEAENTVTIRDNAERILLADQLINVTDRLPAEVVLEVEVLQIDRTKSENIGLSFGSQISIIPQNVEISNVFPLNDFNIDSDNATLSLPTATLNYFKQAVDARTLASPRIRALNKQPAKFHVGDEIPLASSEIVETTGQSRTTFERREVGIRLNVTPQVRLNSSVTIEIVLEVSRLGQNLGTPEQPQFSIGTRNIETTMLLEDGETAIIGGLIADEDRETIVAVPGLGKIPVIGRMFRNRDSSGTRTDIILTLTPRVVRQRDLPGLGESEFFSGTGARVASINANDFLEGPANGSTPTIRLDLSGAQPSAAERIPLPPAGSGAAPLSPDAADPVLSFRKNAYDANQGEDFDVVLTASGFPSNTSGQAVIRFRPELVSVNTVESSTRLPFEIDNERGIVTLELTPQISGLATREIATLKFSAKSTGLSYLIFGNPVGSRGAAGLPENTGLRNSRIVVR